VFQKLWAVDCVMRHQTGDTEMRAVFAVELLATVASVIRAKRWGGSGRGRSKNFAPASGQSATSRRPEPRNAGSQGVSGGPGHQSPEQLLLMPSAPANAADPVAPPGPPPDNAAEKTRRRGRPRRREMTLSGLHQKFLRYWEGERRLSPQTVVAYRSDFSQFVEALRAQSRWDLMSQDVVGTLSLANVRLYQYPMAGQGASRVEQRSSAAWCR
jgi:Phage integrase, N-terminal SAM-like domain